ncbi:MAG: LysM peptidoglycan-binding domain-containing protein [Candidatus Aminicenantes bacterium]|nr:MAG: LysM peptidoglycan-binding domain-containing protein [Candidatus Aminicenantes bacterium]
MKKFFLLLMLAAFIFISCGVQKPKTEPVEPPAPTETEEASQPPQHIEEETTEAPGKEAAEGKEYQQKPTEPTEVKPIEEVIPVIEPEKKPTEIQTADTLEIKKITDGITSGITSIFKEFGYSGDIDVPLNFKKRVSYYIGYFSKDEKGSRFYLRTMSRGSQYLPMIKRILQEKHLPLSLAYLPVIESGFNPNARSRAGAVGMWQFMKGTARMYGLKVTRVKDDRQDPIKSTYAAAEYLNDLLAMFGLEDPLLGICAFNAGEGKILNALRQISYTERSFWTLVKKDLLKSETDEYIPQFLAVILMAKNPEKYAAASHVVFLEPEEVKTVEEEDLEVISTLHHSSTKDNLGEEATKPPVKTEVIELKKVETKTAQPPAKKKTGTTSSSLLYKVKRGDTLYGIARRYNVGLRNLKRWNNLRSNRIYPGQKLKIYSSGTRASITKSKGYKLIYTVNYTDSLARIALFFKGVSARDIMTWNRLRRTRIYPKQKLALYLEEPPRKVVTHIVKRGESAFKIAKKYGLRVEYVLSLNGLVTNSRLRPGQRLKIYYF